jgi:DNA-binding MarR family transcriptional regulator
MSIKQPCYSWMNFSRLAHCKMGKYSEEQGRRIASHLGNLSPNQRAVISALAKMPTDTPTGKDIQLKTRLSNASLVQALQVLRNKDIIYADENGIQRPLDPVIEYLLKE